jgi:biuret amidohydrolase
MQQVKGIYDWPYDGAWDGTRTALIIVDMQRDFLDPDGWFSLTGGAGAPLRAIIPAIVSVLDLARKLNMLVVYTAEAHRPDLSDLPARKLWQSGKLGAEIGSMGPLGRHLVIGEPGAGIIPELAPKKGEPIVHKPGKSAFIGTDFDQLLRKRSIRNMIFVGITTDGAVQCTLRDANDRGYECLILSDASASDDPHHHREQIHTLSLSDGLYGSIATFADLQAATLLEAVS